MFYYPTTGTIPGPVLLGAVFDGSCSLWQSRCGESRGSCLSYHNDRLALYTFFMCAGIKILSIVFLVIAWRSYQAGSPETMKTTLVAPSNGNVINSIGSKDRMNKEIVTPTYNSEGIITQNYEQSTHL